MRRTLSAGAVVSLLAIATSPTSASAQQPMTIVDSYKRAYDLLEAAIAAHGGPEALAAARHMRLTARGYEYHMHQSRRVAPPLDSTVFDAVLMTDIPRGRVVYEDTRGYPGGFYYTNRRVTSGTEAFAIDMRNRRYTASQGQPPTDSHGDVFLPPQFRLLQIHRVAGGSLRSLGRMRLASGAEVDVITARMPAGFMTTLGFDPVTHRLHALVSPGGDLLIGDHPVETEFLGYRMLNGMLLPTEWVTRRGGIVVSRYRYTSAEPGYQIPDSLLRPPAGFTQTPAPAAGEPLRTLGSGLWAVRSGGNWSLLAEFRDHLLVVDAGSASASDILSRVATIAPNKPLRYVVPTHHHSDHFNGVRTYAAAGVTTVTTPGNLELFRRVITAPVPLLVANLARPPAEAASRVETISGKRRVFSDGTRTVEIHDVGPTGHAEEILVAWVPSEGVLFQADLIEAATGQALPGSASPTTVRLAEFIKQRGWNVKVFAGSHGFLDDPAQFEALVRLPVIPPG